MPSPSHRAEISTKKTLKALCFGEDMCALIFMHEMLKGRQQKFRWDSSRYLFLNGQVMGLTLRNKSCDADQA